jgi:chromosome partitioning protein
MAAEPLLSATPAGVAEASRDTYVAPVQEPRCIAVAAAKGGIGKSRLARELAYVLMAVLCDLEWDKGGSSFALGYDERQRKRAPLIDALKSGKTPRPISGKGRKPDLIPGHKDLERNQPTPEYLAETLTRWSEDLQRRLVMDTHPGGSPTAYGAMLASRVTVVPQVLGVDELNALEGMLEDMSDYPLLVVPYQVERAPKAWALDRFDDLKERFEFVEGPPVGYYPWMKDVQHKTPLTARRPSKRTGPFIEEIHAVAEAVLAYGQ